MKNITELNVSCAIIIKDDKVIIAQRSECMRLPLKWEFPGGKIEKDESAEDCIHREVMEELNIKVDIKMRLNSSTFQYKDIKVCLMPFVVEYISGAIQLKEHKQFKFVNKNDLNNYDFAEADIPIINSFLEL